MQCKIARKDKSARNNLQQKWELGFSPRKRKQENVNKISEQKTSKSKIEKQNKNKK